MSDMPFTLSNELQAILNGKNVYCGFSGGADSLTLLLLLMNAGEAFHFTLNVIHFEHGLRGRAGLEDAEFCRTFCEQNKLPFTCISLNVNQNILPGEGVEAAARRLRMDYWKKLPPHSIVALGHNSDDLTENLILRLMRGSNVSGLTSLAEYNETEGVAIIRPLLYISRKEIIEYLEGRGLEWRTDATNLESEYGRNFLRNRILPEIYEKFPYAKGGFLRSLENLSSDAHFIDDQALLLYRSRDFSQRSSWLGLHPALFCRIFRLFLSEKIGYNIYSGHQLIARFESMIRNHSGQGYTELEITDCHDFSLFIGDEQLFFINKKPVSPVQWNPEETPELNILSWHFSYSSVPTGKGDGIKTAAFDQDSLQFPVTIRQIKPGDKMIPFGKQTPVSVKKFLSDAAVPIPLRNKYPVISDASGEIIWIPGIKRSGKYPARDSRFFTFSFSIL